MCIQRDPQSRVEISLRTLSFIWQSFRTWCGELFFGGTLETFCLRCPLYLVEKSILGPNYLKVPPFALWSEPYRKKWLATDFEKNLTSEYWAHQNLDQSWSHELHVKITSGGEGGWVVVNDFFFSGSISEEETMVKVLDHETQLACA